MIVQIGIYHGNLLEFKLDRKSLSKTLFQSIKYLSKERVKGHNVPATIINIFLNQHQAYIYKSINYFKEIHTLYNGAASKNNDEFINKFNPIILDLDKPEDHILLMQTLQENNFTKIDIDESCIVGWAERYYKENPTKTKDDFLKEDGELRKPNKFKDFINPYTGESNEKFKYIMDKLNDKLKKKKLGAFYTPIPYCEKAAELVREAIKRVPEGNDYIILDRCAGTGNLESVLTDEELSHCVLSTYEYYEWLVLRERLEDKVKMILPENKENITFDNGLIKENDAMSEQFVNNSYIKQFVDNPKCTIIILENPPYQDETSGQKGGTTASGKSLSYVLSEMKKSVKGKDTNELANRFIWSASYFYIRDITDSIVLFSPIKYWKQSSQILSKTFINGFVFNKKHFHATPSAITCILWGGAEKNENKIICDVYNILDNKIEKITNVAIKKAFATMSQLYDKSINDEDIPGECFCNKDGTEADPNLVNIRVSTKYNSDIIGWIEADAFQCDQISTKLVRCRLYNGNDFPIRKNSYLKKLPLFCVKQSYAYREHFYDDLFVSTSDGGTKFESDQVFLKSCLIYTCLCQFNKCLSFKGSDGRDYYNELCFDSLSTHKSQALIDLPNFKLNAKDRSLLKLYDKIMKEASQTKNYNKDYSYGLYQIIQELNTYSVTSDNKKIPDYPSLADDIDTIRKKLKTYYKEFIEPKCFKYELLK